MPPGHIAVSRRQKTEFEEQGFTILRGPAIVECKKSLHRTLQATAARIIARQAPQWAPLARKPFADVFNGCIAREKDNSISRIFYELFPSVPEILSLVTHPLFHESARRLAVAVPIPSTPPIMRIDRPGEDKYMTPVHQDFWYSMLSRNSVTYWMPLLPVTADMGLLSAVPGSHKLGLLPTKPWTENNPFTTARTFEESAFSPIFVNDDELLVFSQLLVHRSSPNKSRKARLTLQVRYNDLETMETITSSFTPKYSPHVSQAQARAVAGAEPRPEHSR